MTKNLSRAGLVAAVIVALSILAGIVISKPSWYRGLIEGNDRNTSESNQAENIKDTQGSAMPAGNSHPGRQGALTPREMEMAKAAWQYFVAATQENTGLANAVLNYPSTTLWDTASYIAALVSARELGIIDKREFDLRTLKLLGTLQGFNLFRGELPNKVYNTKTGEKVNYENKPGEVGYSALDIGRMMVWLYILKQRYPYLANSADGVMLRWKFCNVVDANGKLYGAGIGANNQTKYHQEGRLGYEEYAAKGFALWGFDTRRASEAGPFDFIDILGIKVPYDTRDPRVYKTQNYVLTESYLLDGLELNWDLPDDNYSDPFLHTDGWRAEFAQRIYVVQEKRFEKTGILTARSEHQVKGDPFFVYDSIYASGYPWNTLSPKEEYVPERAAVAIKGALGMWALWNTEYTSKLFDSVAEVYTPEKGFYEGVYENGSGFIPLHTANNNGVVLEALLYKAQGPILQQKNISQDTQAWYEGSLVDEQREQRCLPKQPLEIACSKSNCRCEREEAQATLKLEEYLYCEPVPSDGWYPGDALLHKEPAARNCQVEEPKSFKLVTPLRRQGH